MKIKALRDGLAVAAAAALLGSCGAETTDEGVVARVDDYELTVDEAVQLLVDEERLAADAGVVESLAQLWIDYTLLAEAAAEDSTFSDLDLEPLVMRQLDQVMVFQLRDSVIQVDTFLTDDELRSMYDAESPEVALRARHIMLRLPIGADVAARDSVRSELEAIRRQIIGGGADFAEMARQHSQDPGSARAGGDLGYFGRGDMVTPIEETALALEPGEVSEVVQTPMGLHLIRLEERRIQSFEEAAPRFRGQVQARMVQEAESVFVSGVVDRVDPQVTGGAADVVRDLAANPGAGMTGRARRRAVVEWDGGSVTVGDVRRILQLESPMLRDQLSQDDDALVEEFLLGVARRRILVREAEAAGLRPATDSIDVLVGDARDQLRSAARRLGLLDLDQAPGERLEVAVERAVLDALNSNVSGATQVVPLGLVSFQLREGRSSTVLDAGVGQVILQVGRIRAARQLSPAEESLVPPDTASR